MTSKQPNSPIGAETHRWRIPWPEDWVGRPVKQIGAVLALMLLAVMVLAPTPDGLKPEAFRVLIVMGVAMCLWLPEVFHPSVSALILTAILPFTGALTYEESLSGLGNKIIWLLMSVSFLTTALHNTGLDRRFAFFVLRRSGGSSAGMLLAVIMTGFLATFIVPNAESRTALLVTLSVGILQALGVKPLESNIGRGMLVATSLTALLSSAAIMTGASATMYAAGYFDSVLGFHWTYFDWLAVMLPGVLLTCLAMWLIILKVFPPERSHVGDGLQFLDDEVRKMGPLRPPERKVIFLLVLLFAMLLFGQRVNIPREMAFMLVGLLLFMPGIAVVDWATAVKRTQWGTLIFFASSLTLSKAVVTSGAAEWVAGHLVGVVSGLPLWLLTVAVMLLFLALRFVFTNMTSVLTTLMPVVTSLAVSSGRNPVWLGMIAVISSALCLFTPMQSASNFTAYSAGYYAVGDLAKVGILVAIAVIGITLLMAYVYWPLFGLTP